MKFPKIITVYKVKINYKSGISETFECVDFSIKGKSLTWKSFSHRCRPLDIAFDSADYIESVWQVGFRKAIIWE